MFRSRRGRRNPYELAQISLCRQPILTGLTDCQTPDQVFSHIVSYNEWMSNFVFNNTSPGDFLQSTSPHSGKSITVKGIQFDYQYSLTPQHVGEGNEAAGVLSIRTALCVLRAAPQGSGGSADAVQPFAPPGNLLFRNETTRRNVQSTAGALITTANRIRMLWRGMEMMGTVLSSDSTVIEAGAIQVPRYTTQSRHVRVRTSCRLARDEALFLVTEVINPFLEDNPTLALDLFGSLVVKTNFTGPVKYDTTS